MFRPAAHVVRLPDEQVRRLYPKFRWQILEATFIGYATFYFVRNNLPVVSKEMGQALHYSKSQIGDLLALTAIAYGIGKFVMGAWSDRSNPRYFMPAGLLATALCNFAFGAVNSYPVHLVLWTLNGLAQGMGWAPCGRSLSHWYSVRERGTVFAFWNIAVNVGGGLTGLIAAYSTAWMGWRSAFYVPGVLAVLCAVYLIVRLRDTPQSVGLPPIEEYRNDYPEDGGRDSEAELGTRDLLVHYVLKNRYLWLFAAANFFVYISRYSMLDWGPTYLKEVKHASLEQGGFSTAIFELGGIFSVLLMGWLSDKAGGRRGMITVLCMVPVFLAFAGILYAPAGMLWLNLTLFGIVGFFVYPSGHAAAGDGPRFHFEESHRHRGRLHRAFWLSRPHGPRQDSWHSGGTIRVECFVLCHSGFHVAGDCNLVLDLEAEAAHGRASGSRTAVESGVAAGGDTA